MLRRALSIPPILASLLAFSAGASAASVPVTTFPSPGTHWALPQTQLTFRGVAPGAIGPIQVVASSSGTHGGQIAADSDGDGASFLPTTPFRPGETVTVRTHLNVLGAKGGSYTFTVESPAPGIPFAPVPLVPAGAHGVQHFHSRTDLEPPTVSVTRNAASSGPGDIFVAPQFGPVQQGPMVFDPDGNLIWFKPAPKGNIATDFRVQSYGGQPVLTWWEGFFNRGLGAGFGVIADSTYANIATVRAGNGLRADLHEFQLTPSGTALIIAVAPVNANLTSIHGAKHAVVMDSVIQEIDIKTGLVLFEWHGLGHVSLSESYVAPPRRNGHIFDFFHANSVGLDRDGNLIVSARNTSAAYKIDHQTGAVMWRLGGRRSSFKMRSGTSFAYQHDVRVQSDGTVTLFDDGATPPVHKQSRALRLHLNYARMTASWVAQDEHSSPLLAGFEGNHQLLPNGDSFVGWGQQPYFTEFSPRGQTVFDAHFLEPTASYRAYRQVWTGQPVRLPKLAASTSHGRATVYASWNGATTYTQWRVLAGASSGSLRSVSVTPRNGFETKISVASSGPYFAAQALNASGQILSTSAPIKAHG